MNPKDIEDQLERMRLYGDAHGEYNRLNAQLKARQRAEATSVIDDLHDALGVKLDGATLEGDLAHVSLPLSALRLIISRLTALAAGNVLSEGAL